jgi:membrane associated rhomboid family serine protease
MVGMHPEGVLLITAISVAIGILILRHRGQKLRLPIATLALALLTFVVGLLVLADQTLPVVLGRDFGAIALGEWWHFVTAMFAQDPSWFPILFNVIALLVIGTLFESAFGWWMLLLTFFGAGLVSEVAGYLLNQPAGFTGNSVANSGLAGMLAVVALTLPLPARALGILSILAAVALYARGLFIFAFPDLHPIGYFAGALIGLVYVVVGWARTRAGRNREPSVAT